MYVQGGYLGHAEMDNSPDSLKPTLVPGLQARAIAAGRVTAAAVAVNGSLFTWGSSPLGRPGPQTPPGLVRGLEEHRILKVCMGEYHGTAVDEAGQVFLWGSTGDGQLKEQHGSSLEETAAPLQGLPEGTVASAVACGNQHTLIVTHTLLGSSGDVQHTDTGPNDLTESADTIEVLPGLHNAQEYPTQDSDTQNVPAFDAGVGGRLQAAGSEECPGGAPLPAWISDCAQIPEQTASIDAAWYGKYSAPTLDVVRPFCPQAHTSSCSRGACQHCSCLALQVVSMDNLRLER